PAAGGGAAVQRRLRLQRQAWPVRPMRGRSAYRLPKPPWSARLRPLCWGYRAVSGLKHLKIALFQRIYDAVSGRNIQFQADFEPSAASFQAICERKRLCSVGKIERNNQLFGRRGLLRRTFSWNHLEDDFTAWRLPE